MYSTSSLFMSVSLSHITATLSFFDHDSLQVASMLFFALYVFHVPLIGNLGTTHDAMLLLLPRVSYTYINTICANDHLLVLSPSSNSRCLFLLCILI
jgi:hypothetical protein